MADQFLEQLETVDLRHAAQRASFIHNVSKSDRIMPPMLRPERPELGVYAMYKHENGNGHYNPSRLLCSFVGTTDRILPVVGGFIQTTDEPIQHNAAANREAELLAQVVKLTNQRVNNGEITNDGSLLIPQYRDSFMS